MIERLTVKRHRRRGKEIRPSHDRRAPRRLARGDKLKDARRVAPAGARLDAHLANLRELGTKRLEELEDELAGVDES